jgi:outer membrane beta-barrel protein
MRNLILSLFALLSMSARAADAPPADDGSTRKNETAAKGEDFQRVDERTPRLGTPLIANKLYPMASRFEITGVFDYSFNDKYVQHLGGGLALTFHIFDFLAVEGFGGVNGSCKDENGDGAPDCHIGGDETGIVRNVRNEGSSHKKQVEGQPCANDFCEPQLPDMWQTQWFAGADVQWAPIYGKISAVSEYDLNFQLYALAGGGAEGISRKLNDLSYDTPQTRITANYGLGVRLIPWKYVALRAEIRNYNGINPNVEEHESRDEDDCRTGYTLVVGNTRQCYPDISNNTMLQVGLSLIL